MATTAHAQHASRPEPPDPRPGPLVCDRLDMLVTGDPVAELDAALATAATQLRAARGRGDTHTAARLVRWIDTRLDERTSFIQD